MIDDKVQLPILIKRAARLIDIYTEHVLENLPLSRSKYRVLYYVNLLGNPTQKNLIEKINVKGSTLTIIVDSLEQKGWLFREEDSKDKRVRRLRLTPEGQKLYDSITDPIAEITAKLTKTFDVKEMSRLEQRMRAVIKTLK